MAEENTKAASGKIKEEEVKKVALTFDDGPNPDHTETLLEGLKERNVKATFFLLGAECEKYPDYFWTDRRTCAVYQTALRLLEMQS